MTIEFIRPTTLRGALQTLAESGEEAKLLAGGTALSILLRHKLIEPRRLVSLEALPELRTVQTCEQGLQVGSMVRLRDIERSATIRESYPILAAACGEVGNVRVRNQATLGGNLAEADYASDPPTALLALNATVRIASLAGDRTVPISEFFQGFFTTVLEPREILVEILIPPLPKSARGAYLKYKSRSSEDRPCVVVAAVADFQDGLCGELRVAVGAACETPRRLPEVEALATGQQLTEDRVAQIAEAYSEQIETIEDLRGSGWYRREMIRVFVRRALREVQAVSR